MNATDLQAQALMIEAKALEARMLRCREVPWILEEVEQRLLNISAELLKLSREVGG